MKSLTNCVTVLFVFTILTACNSDHLRERELALKEKELELQQHELDLQNKTGEGLYRDTSEVLSAYVAPKPVTKYMYVVVETNEPKIVQVTSTYKPAVKPSVDPEFKSIDEQINPDLPLYSKSVEPQYYTYTSPVIEVSDFSEDAQLREEDRYEQEHVRPALAAANRRIERQNAFTLGSSVSAEATLLSRKSYVFDTYAEASKDRLKSRSSEQ